MDIDKLNITRPLWTQLITNDIHSQYSIWVQLIPRLKKKLVLLYSRLTTYVNGNPNSTYFRIKMNYSHNINYHASTGIEYHYSISLIVFDYG